MTEPMESLNDWDADTLTNWLAERLRQPLPGRAGQLRGSPELSYGRHFGPPPRSVRRAAVLIALYPGPATRWTIPLTLRPANLAVHPGQVSLPGGMVEAGETDQDAAIREFAEELGVEIEPNRVLGRLSPLYIHASNYHVQPLVTVIPRPTFTPDPLEVDQALELDVENALALDPFPTLTIKRRGIRFRAPYIPLEPTPLWGATCMILAELLATLKKRKRGTRSGKRGTD